MAGNHTCDVCLGHGFPGEGLSWLRARQPSRLEALSEADLGACAKLVRLEALLDQVSGRDEDCAGIVTAAVAPLPRSAESP